MTPAGPIYILRYELGGSGYAHSLAQGETSVGRMSNNTLILVDRAVSSRHAVVRVAEHDISIRDAGSSGGTWVNGLSIREAGLAAGDMIRMGRVQLKLELRPSGLPGGAALPRRLGQWELREPLGSSGTVFKAVMPAQFDPNSKPGGRHHWFGAVRALWLGATADRVSVQSLKSAARLVGPQVAQILDMGRENGVLYFAHFHCAEGSLARCALAAAGQGIPAMDVLREVARALDQAHGEGIVHGRVRPKSVWVDHRDQVRVGDFGLAAVCDAAGVSRLGIPGLSEFLAPEVIEGRPTTTASDVYGLARIVKWLQELGQLTHSNAASEDVLAKGLAREAEARWARAGEMVESLVDAWGVGSGRRTITVASRVPAQPTAPAATVAPQTPRESSQLDALNWTVGRVIQGIYEVRGVLGEGGMGRVYRVHHRGWDLDMAVKRPKPIALATATLESVIREAETWVQLGFHPHVVPCFYVRTIEGTPSIFSEYVEGGTLQEWIKDGRLYDGGAQQATERIIDVAIQIALGLEHAHGQGLVHQDVKPANVMMTPKGEAKLNDFGLAKAFASVGNGSPALDQPLVSFAGLTPAYCSPEHALRERLSPKSDVWSWAVSVLEMFAGELTWRSGQAAPEVLRDLARAGPRFPGPPPLGPEVAALLSDCLVLEPSARPSASQVAARLAACFERLTGEHYARIGLEQVDLADSKNNRAISLIDLGRDDEALELWQAALEKDPAHFLTRYNQGLWQWRKGLVADDRLVSALSGWSSSPRGIESHLLANVAHEAGDSYKALKILSDMAGRFPDSPELEIALRRVRGTGTPMPRPSVWKGAGTKRRANSRDSRERPFGVSSVSSSADGGQALLVAEDGVARVWHLARGGEVRLLGNASGPDEAESASSGTLSRDGRFALVDESRGLVLWDLTKGSRVSHLELGFRPESFAMDGAARRAVSARGLTVRIWDLATARLDRELAMTYSGRPLKLEDRQFEPHLLAPQVWIDQAGRTIVARSVGRRGYAQVFDLEAEETRELALPGEGRLGGLAPDGRLIAGLDGADVVLVDIREAREAGRLRGHRWSVSSVSFSSDGRWALSTSHGEGSVRLWRVDERRCLRTWRVRGAPRAALSANARLAVFGGSDGWVEAVPLSAEMPRRAPLQLARPLPYAQLRSSNTRVRGLVERAHVAMGARLAIEAVDSLREAREIPGFEKAIETRSAWRQLALQCRRTRIRGLWQRSLLSAGAEIACLRSTLGGSLAVTAGAKVIVWDVDDGRALRELGGAAAPAACLTPNGRFALVGAWDGKQPSVWDTRSGDCVGFLGGHKGDVLALACSPDGRLIASADTSGAILLWSIDAHDCLGVIELGRPVRELRFSADGQLLYALGDRVCSFWVAGRIRIHGLAPPGPYSSLAVSDDGLSAMAGSRDSSVSFWRLGDRRFLDSRFTGHSNTVTACELFPGVGWGVSAGADARICFWNPDDNWSCAQVIDQEAEVTGLACSLDGQRMLSSSVDGTLRVFELEWELEIPNSDIWAEGVRPFLSGFLARHGHVAGGSNEKACSWTEHDLQQLLATLGQLGWGWIDSERIRAWVEQMAGEKPRVPFDGRQDHFEGEESVCVFPGLPEHAVWQLEPRRPAGPSARTRPPKVAARREPSSAQERVEDGLGYLLEGPLYWKPGDPESVRALHGALSAAVNSEAPPTDDRIAQALREAEAAVPDWSKRAWLQDYSAFVIRLARKYLGLSH